jgi:hypothetical protein
MLLQNAALYTERNSYADRFFSLELQISGAAKVVCCFIPSFYTNKK